MKFRVLKSELDEVGFGGKAAGLLQHEPGGPAGVGLTGGSR
jgi:hypothetical protein